MLHLKNRINCFRQKVNIKGKLHASMVAE